MREKRLSVYLAGPTVFLPNAVDVFDEMKRILTSCGLSGVAPLDNQIGLEAASPGRPLAMAIYRADEALMQSLDAAIFDVSPFRRGTEMDAGTAFEVGYCRALRKPIVGWTSDPRTYPELVRDFFARGGDALSIGAASVAGAKSGAHRDPDGVLVHSEGLHQNLMIEMAIEASGGHVHADRDWRRAFSAAGQELANMLSKK